MAISYKGLWKLLIDRNMNKTELRNRARLSTNVIAKLGKGEPVSLDVIEKICKSLDCTINEVVEFTIDSEE